MAVDPRTIDVADRMSIIELRHRYCHYADAHQYERWADLFTEDAVLDAEGRERHEGRDAIQSFGENILDDEYDYSTHLVSTPVITTDGERATGKWYVFLTYTLSDHRAGWKQGTYDEEYRLTDAGWKFSRVEATFQATQTYHTIEVQ